MDRQLSQQEIDAVFQEADRGAEDLFKKAVPFDFRRPDRIAKSQLRAIHMLHETFVRNLASSLSAYLRSYLTVNLISVEQLSYGEFVRSLSSPTCLVSLGLKPYDGNALIELSPALIFPLVEIILGGKGSKTPANIRREITEIEQSLLDSLFRIILNDLREAWKGVTTVDFTIEAMETEPQLLHILAPNEAVVAIGIEIRIGDVSGTLNLALPSINIKMIGQKFDQQWSTRRSESTQEEQYRMLKLLFPSRVKVEAQLLGPQLLVEDILKLAEGDVLVFDSPVLRPLTLLVNGTPKFEGHVGTSGKLKAFQIQTAAQRT